MLYHHGASIDKKLTIEAYKRQLQGRELPPEFATAYVNVERLAKPYLEQYIAAILNQPNFSLDSDDDYKKLLQIIEINSGTLSNSPMPKKISCVMDAANWYRRIAYYLKASGQISDPKLDFYSNNAIQLYESLATVFPSFQETLADVYKEQEIQKN